MNVDENQVMPQQYGVMSIPTLIFFAKGTPVDQSIGFVSEEALIGKLEKAFEV
ncbi:MAG: thioredoxin domain-containing protein [bacterium]